MKLVKAFSMALQENNIDRVNDLLKYGIDLNNNNIIMIWDYPLMYTIKQGMNEMTELLLQYGADPNIQNSSGDTPLMCAITYFLRVPVRRHITPIYNPLINPKSMMKIIKSLMQYGANPMIPNYSGSFIGGVHHRNTPWSVANRIGNQKIIRILNANMKATKIQSRFRGNLTRNKNRMQRSLKKLTFAKMAEQYNIPYDMMTNIATGIQSGLILEPEPEAEATKIQSRFRGNLTRNKNRMQRSLKNLTFAKMAKQYNIPHEMMTNIATGIQSGLILEPE